MSFLLRPIALVVALITFSSMLAGCSGESEPDGDADDLPPVTATATPTCAATPVSLSHGGLAVADTNNSRVMGFTPPFSSNGMDASVAVGQCTFTTGVVATTQSGMGLPVGAAFDSSGNLWTADNGNNRVLQFVPPFENNQAAGVVIGQADFTSKNVTSPPTASSLHNPLSLTLDTSGNLWVADSQNCRVLEFVPSGTPAVFSNGQSASVVIGQADFITTNCITTQQNLNVPAGVAFDGAGDLWVSDDANNRVLEFVPSGTPAKFTDGQNASVVIGQPDFTHKGAGLSASLLSTPRGLAFDKSGNLWVADELNNRVLEFEPAGTPPAFSNGQSASVVIGQADFTLSASATTQNGLFFPTSVAFDAADNLWVTDSNNDRVLEFIPVGGAFTSNQNASLVLGQADFTHGGNATSQNGLNFPQGLAFSP